MKTVTSKWLFVMILLLFVSCEKNEAERDSSTPNHEKTHLIPLEHALAALNNLLESTSTKESKAEEGVQEREIANVITITADGLNTKANEDIIKALDCEDVMYLVNFEQKRGFAILSADDRIGENIVAITESGEISERQIIESFIRNQTRQLQETKSDIPSTTIDQMNFYDDENDDYYIGNYTDPEGSNSTSSEIEIVTDLCTGFITNQLNSFVPPCDSLIGDETVYSDYVINYSSPVVNKMLSQLYDWSQSVSPFNDNLPYAFFSSQKAHTGCVNLALSKIITYHSFPQNTTMNGIPIDWTAMKTNVSSSAGRSSVSALIGYVYSCTTNAPFKGGTFTLPSTARTCLQALGYQNISYTSYSSTTVKRMLDDGCPVLISSLPRLGFLNYDFMNSHAWNIDGYLYRTKTTTFYYYNGDILDHTNTMTETSTMVHCDWGWGGNCNGYFVSGIFDLLSNDNLYDGLHYGHSSNYNFYIKIISYDNPNS